MRFKAALFDLDGTLLDTEGQYTEIWGRIGQKYCPQVQDLPHVIKGTTLVQILDNYFPDASVRRQVVEALNEGEREMVYKFYPGAMDFVSDLRRHGVMCAVVTSSNMPKMHSLEQQIPSFYGMFDLVLTSEDFAASKPAPDCYLLAANRLNCGIEDCVVFEDALSGLQAGVSAGMYTVGMATTMSREDIVEHCNLVLDSFQDLTTNSFEEIVGM